MSLGQIREKPVFVKKTGFCLHLAEGEGFEPPVLSHNGFQDRHLRPLGHPSAGPAMSTGIQL